MSKAVGQCDQRFQMKASLGYPVVWSNWPIQIIERVSCVESYKKKKNNNNSTLQALKQILIDFLSFRVYINHDDLKSIKCVPRDRTMQNKLHVQLISLPRTDSPPGRWAN